MTRREVKLPSGKKTTLVIGNKQRMFAGLGLFVPSPDGEGDTLPELDLRQKTQYAESIAELVCLCAPELKLTTREPAPRGLTHYNDVDDADWDYLFTQVMELWGEAAAAARPTGNVQRITTAS